MFGAAVLFGAVPRGGSAEPAQNPPVVAMLPIRLLDTSAEPVDQTTEHARRIEAMAERLAAELNAAGGYRVVRVSEAVLEARCPDQKPACLLELVRSEGASLAFIGVVHKSSTLIMQIWARLVDVTSGKDVFVRDLNFRGDNDESWQRAARFLGGQMKTEAPSR